MDDNILVTIKKLLGLGTNYDAFDTDVQIYINAAIFTLYQNGIPRDTSLFNVKTGEETWATYLGADHLLESVKTYIYLSVRLRFDPPATSFAIKAFEDMKAEELWRLNIQADNIALKERI